MPDDTRAAFASSRSAPIATPIAASTDSGGTCPSSPWSALAMYCRRSSGRASRFAMLLGDELPEGQQFVGLDGAVVVVGQDQLLERDRLDVDIDLGFADGV